MKSPTPSSHTPLGTPPAYKRVEHKERKTNEDNNSSSKDQSESQNKKNGIKSVSILGVSPAPKSEENPKKPRVAMPTGKTEEMATKSEKNKFSLRKEKKPVAPLPDYLARHVTPSPDYPLLLTPAKTTGDYPPLPPRTTPSPDYLADRTIPSPDYLSSRWCLLKLGSISAHQLRIISVFVETMSQGLSQ